MQITKLSLSSVCNVFSTQIKLASTRSSPVEELGDIYWVIIKGTSSTAADLF